MARNERIKIVTQKNFLQPEELAGVYKMNADEVMRMACLSDSVYQIGRTMLINRKRFDETVRKISELGNYQNGTFALLEDAVIMLGLPKILVLQLASDGDALIMVEKKCLICIEKLSDYVLRFRKKVDLIDFDDLVERAQYDKRRAKE